MPSNNDVLYVVYGDTRRIDIQYWLLQFIISLALCECLHEHRKFKSPTDIFSRFQSDITLQENRVKYKLKPFNTIGHCQYFNNMLRRSLCRYLNSTRRHDINSEPSVQSSLNALRVLEVRKVWKWKMRSLEVRLGRVLASVGP